MKTITATVNEKGTVTLSENVLGNAGEHNSTVLKFVIPEAIISKVDYFRIWTDGKFSEKLTANSTTGIVEFTVPQSLYNVPVLRMQLVGYKSDEGLLVLIWKSSVFKLSVEISVEGTNFIPEEAYDPLEEALVQCANTIDYMTTVTEKLKLDSESLENTLKLAKEQKSEAEKAVYLAEREVERARDVLNECELIKSSCISYGIYKVDTPEAIETNEIEDAVATSDAVKNYIDKQKNGLAGKMELEEDTLSLLTNETAETPNSKISSVSLEKYAKKERLEQALSEIFNIEECYNYDYLQYLQVDKSETLTVGKIYKTQFDSVNYGEDYPAGELYIWTGTEWATLDLVNYIKDIIKNSNTAVVDNVFNETSENAQSGVAIWNYVNSEFLSETVEQYNPQPVRSRAIYDALAEKANKKESINLESNSTVTLNDNTEYYGANINNLTITYPKGKFECWLYLDLSFDEKININLPESRYIGEEPEFSAGQVWELSIKNGVVIAQKASN